MRTRFDQFAKQVAQVAFAERGTVHTDEEVSPDVGRIDVWYTPRDPAAPKGATELGMFGRIGLSAFTMEAFHQAPDPLEVMDCICKHHAFRKLCEKRAPDSLLPVQWIISAGRPVRALDGLWCAADDAWGAGVYDLPPILFSKMIVVAELPRTRDTLMLRLMGAGRTLRDAIADLRALEDNAPERVLSLPLLLRLRIEIEQDPNRNAEEEELLMTPREIIDAYQAEMAQHRKEARVQALVEGRAEGRVEGQAEGVARSILKVYARRFGPPPADVAERISHMLDPETLDAWLDLAATGAAEDLPRAVRNLPTS